MGHLGVINYSILPDTPGKDVPMCRTPSQMQNVCGTSAHLFRVLIISVEAGPVHNSQSNMSCVRLIRSVDASSLVVLES
jgi:hypothetical protein